jgi:hypothetical protein
MPFIRGRYHINPVAGAALEAARDAEAALLALQRDAQAADADSADDPDDSRGNRLSPPVKGPIHRVEIEAAEAVPAYSGRATRGFVARVHRTILPGDPDASDPLNDDIGNAASPSSSHPGTDNFARVASSHPETHVFADHRDLVNFLRTEFAKDCTRR